MFWTQRFRRRETVRYADPLEAGRHPFQTYLLAISVITGIPIIFDQPPAAETIESLLPTWVGIVWGLSLLFGPILGLVGSYWPRKNYATALTIERIGLTICGPSAVLYGVVIVMATGSSRLVAAGIVFGFGIACISRARDIATIIRRAIPGPSPIVRREGESEAHAILRDEEDSP